MPLTVNTSAIIALEPIPRRRAVLLTLWRSCPGVTDKYHPLDPDILKGFYWTTFCNSIQNMGAVAGLVTSYSEDWAMPWLKGLDSQDGQHWAYAFMFAALQMEGFVGECGRYDVWIPKRFLSPGWEDAVKEVLVNEVYDDWDSMPILERLWSHARLLHRSILEEVGGIFF
ncbi:hypothetical protein J1614_005344 [Plenodomus biglobosus]|nr:hypothetical protein J1614_005344 [Plenodomus biglobosus]